MKQTAKQQFRNIIISENTTTTKWISRKRFRKYKWAKKKATRLEYKMHENETKQKKRNKFRKEIKNHVTKHFSRERLFFYFRDTWFNLFTDTDTHNLPSLFPRSSPLVSLLIRAFLWPTTSSRAAALMKRFPPDHHSQAENCHRKLPRLSPQYPPQAKPSPQLVIMCVCYMYACTCVFPVQFWISVYLHAFWVYVRVAG